ncbi:MAG: 2OG-Fe(II) oxygenase family protein [Proteobacteria bacterium]|nr:2OG-Fe(II) oxygenase family protein [Pseudomonadota bacterium]
MPPWRERRVDQLFPTLVARAELDDPALLASVGAQIFAAERSRPTVARGELTGWQSDNDLAIWSAETGRLVELLAQAMMTAFTASASEDIELFAWANVLRAGDYFSPHTHANAAWSGVLYVDAGDPDSGGLLCFRDPRAGAAMVIGESNRFDSACTVRIAPRLGELVVFPAWLVHWVTPYRGARPRVSVAFNAR